MERDARLSCQVFQPLLDSADLPCPREEDEKIPIPFLQGTSDRSSHGIFPARSAMGALSGWRERAIPIEGLHRKTPPLAFEDGGRGTEQGRYRTGIECSRKDADAEFRSKERLALQSQCEPHISLK
jgi:hypothetical protein